MSNRKKIMFGLFISLFILCAGTSLGSSSINFFETVRIIFYKLLTEPLAALLPSNNEALAGAPSSIAPAPDPKNISIVWQLRLPRALLAFMAGGALAMSGAVFQSVLKNQLASPYIIGVSSGASFGAALVIISGFTLPFIGGFTLPLTGFVFSLLTVFFVIAFSSRLDRTMSNNTVILFGMVVSLFVNALLTTITAVFREELKTLILWQMGSFALKGWPYVTLMLPFLLTGSLGIARYTREMDILTFGEDEAQSVGVEIRGIRKRLFFFAAVLTGGAVALSGAIGFVDLIAPHAARKIVGSNHRYVIPMSFIIGGSLMVVTDLIARTIISPSELPVGAITAIIGAPFFAWVYFKKA
ncbi:corrinoid ABC transporter permease [Spirochaetia bacterium]|nr:corrinoid ABC transporter permease [Spirochaetia bacterium]